MSRQSNNNPDELEGELGARGATRITSENRRLAQNWLIASGVPSIYAKSLTIGALEAIYNDTGNRELTKARQAVRLPVLPAAAPESEPIPNLGRLELPPIQPRKYAYQGATPRIDPVTGGVTLTPHAQETPAPMATQSPETMARLSAMPTDNDRAKKIAEAMRLMVEATDSGQRVAPLDEARVIQLVRQHSAKPDHVTITVQTRTPAEPVTLSDEPRHALFPRVLRAIGQGLNVLIVGPAGSGKTTMAEQVAQALKLDFYMTGAVDSPYKLLGFRDAHGNYAPTAFRRAFEQGGVFLFDEMDASSPGALLSFNAALANGYADFPDGMVKRHADFRVIAAANTYGAGRDRQYVGRNQLDAASRDRFVTLPMDYDENLERALAQHQPGNAPLALAWCAFVQAARKASRDLKIQHVISPRATLQGFALLVAGETLADTIDAVLWRGLEQEQADKIAGQCRNEHAAVSRACTAIPRPALAIAAE